MAETDILRMRRYGSTASLPTRRTLHAGPVSAVLEGVDLRYVKFGDAMIVLRLYMAVRDQNWDTIAPRFTSFTVDDGGDRFRVDFTAEHVSADVDFAWSGTIEGTAEGTIRYAMDGAPRKSFRKNRIGFCVLHPMALAGVAATVATPDGTIAGAFPIRISPDQPFIDMRSISHPIGERGRVTIAFEGDLFEVEDQRNWTDASFKTYCTPLRDPYPVEVTPETRIAQSVTISVSGEPAVAATGAGDADVTIGSGSAGSLPPIGFGAGRKPLPEDALSALRALKPAHLWADLDLGAETWRERLAIVVANAAAVDVPLDLSVIAAPGNAGWNALAAAITANGYRVGRLFVFPPVTYPIVFPRRDLATHPETIVAAREAFAAAGVAARIGGGARAYFTELNRASGVLPIDHLDAVTYTLNPQVHASDNLSLVETLAAQAATVESARAIVGKRPLVVGPVTLKPPYNPNATAEPAPAGPDRLPDPVDPRQLSLFGAGWTLGSLHRLATARADALTYYELAGWRGLVERRDGLTRRELFPSLPGQLFPLFHLFAALAPFAGGSLLPVTLSNGLATEAIAVRAGDRVRVLIANLTEEEREIAVTAGGLGDPRLRLLDETTYDAAAFDPAFFTAGDGEPIAAQSGRLLLSLRPFAVACIDGST